MTLLQIGRMVNMICLSFGRFPQESIQINGDNSSKIVFSHGFIFELPKHNVNPLKSYFSA